MNVTVAAAAAASLISGSTDRAWHDWVRLSHEQCAARHVDWICGDCYLNLIDGFYSTLSLNEKQAVEHIADTSQQCATEKMGFECEAGRSFLAYRKLDLMHRFVRYGCRTVKCEYVASCSRLPPSP